MRVSASKIKTFQSCSWVYFCQYVLKISSGTHPKTKAGSVAHFLFEVLINPRHSKYVDAVKDNSASILDFPSLRKLTQKMLKKIELPEEKWIGDIELLVNAGLKLDFNIDGNIKLYDPEYAFEIKTKNYEANGFIDLAAEMPENRIKIRDYKSQGFKFTEEELAFNPQAIMYQYALFEKTKMAVDVEFVLLRHNQIQEVKWVGEEAIKGFMLYLDFISETLKNFSMKSACSNFAAHDKSKWYKLGCITKFGQIKKNGDPYHCCSYKFPRKIFYVKDKDGEIKYSAESMEEIDWTIFKEDYKIEEFKYRGCRYWYPENYE